MRDLNDIHLRLGQPSDLPLMLELERAYIADHEPQNFQAWQSAMHRHLEQWVRCLPKTVIAATDSETVGYMFWESEAATATLASIHVKPAYRRRGIGRLLLARYEEAAALAKCERSELHVFEGNPARHFYEAAGYGVARSAPPYAVLVKEMAAQRGAS